jgi:radical SAM protein with 4Fe4S-binding SPASM domain
METLRSHRSGGRSLLPILNDPMAGHTSRPMFGSPEVARYGAVGLDVQLTDAASPRASEPAISSVKSEDGKRDVFYVSRGEPLPLADHLAHHEVDDHHLWIAVLDGKVIVADDTDHEIIQALIRGDSPVVAAAHVERARGLDPDVAWRATVTLLGRLAAAGFVKGIQGYHGVKKIRPHSFARFHLTQRCQLECIHCYTDSSPHLPSDGELSVERWIRLTDEFADNGGEKILFTGGEALVYQGCIDIMRRAHERGLEVTLFSNGILIPRYIKELKEVADIVQISVDGPGEESHDAVRGKGSFKKAMRAIHLLLEAKIETRISTTIMMNNWPAIRRDLPKLIAEFEDTELSFRISYGVMPHGRGTSLDHSLDTEEVRRFVDGLLSRVKTTENRDEGLNVVQKISGCGYAEQLVIAPDGLVYPCHLLSGALGHVDDLPVKEITRYLVRTAEAFSVDHRLGCGTCDLRNLCGGSCRVEDEKHTGSRLITTCTPEDKLRKKRFLVRRYRPVTPDEVPPGKGLSQEV